MKSKHTLDICGLILVCLLTTTVLMIGCKEKKPAPSTAKQSVSKTTAGKTSTTAAKTEKTAADTTTATVAQVKEQTTCPVTGSAIDKTVFVEYQGKQVYFCCKACVAKFNAEPKRYLSKLPQFQL